MMLYRNINDVRDRAVAERDEIEPMYTEVEAAQLLGIKLRWLREERYAERISYKRVGGKAMYRHSDLVAWQREGTPRREPDQIKGRNSSASGTRDKKNPYGFSDEWMAAASVQQARDIAAKLRKLPRKGS